jgi:hypothetical protein
VCVDGSYCRAATNKCVAQQTTEGTVCDDRNGCRAPLFCVPDATGTIGTCGRALPQTGAACDPNIGCDDFNEYCTASRVCAKLVAVGQPCIAATATAPDNCVNYAYCTGGVCKAFGTAGAVCVRGTTDQESDCLGDLICPAGTLVCTAPPAAMSCR